MFKYYVGQFFRVISYITLPGIICNIIRSFFLGKRLPFVMSAIPAFISNRALSSLGLAYLSISIIAWPISLFVYLMIRWSIYKKHWDRAYYRQNTERYHDSSEIWDDTNWDKP